MIFPALLRSTRHIAGALLVLALAAAGSGSAWYVARQSTAERLAETEERTKLLTTGLAATYAELINRQIVAFDQTLDSLVREWESDPGFDLEASRSRAAILNGLSRDMFLADGNAVIRQSSVPDFLGQKVGDLNVFRDAADHASDKPKLYLGAAAVNPMMRQWHLDVARTLRKPDGSFAGIIVADYRVSAIAAVFQAARPPGNAFAALVSLTDGKLRATHGPAVATPDASIADTPMFSALDGPESGVWVGPSAADAVVRVHAFQRLPDRDLVAIVGLDQSEVLRPVELWSLQSRIFAGAITGLAVLIAVILLSMLIASHRRQARTRENRALLAAAQALADVSHANADAVSRRLQATFDSLTDGIAIFDAHLNLVEWNGLFPDRSGVNASVIRTGMPMEDVLRTEALAGYFGHVTDIENEVQRRAALLRAGNFGASQSFNARGRTIELRCRPLTEGGFVALYNDATENLRSRQVLRDTKDTLELERATRMRFLNVIAHETGARVAQMLDAAGWLKAAGLPPAHDRAVRRVIRAGEELEDLAADMVELPRLERSVLTMRPALIATRPLLRDAVESIQATAGARGLTVYLAAGDTTPAELIADPARVTRIVSQLLSDAMRFADPGTMWLMADGGGGDPSVALRLTVRGFGMPLAEAARASFFRGFDFNAAPVTTEAAAQAGDIQAGDTQAGDTGLGPSIVNYLAKAMGGTARCEAWSTSDGRTGNDLIVTLPPTLLPGQTGRSPGQAPDEGRPLPRTRVLMIGTQTGSRMAAVTMLRRDGHMVNAAATGAEGMRLLENAPHDIVFVDTAMPDMILETAVNTIRDLSGPARMVPIIAIAPAHDDREARAWLRNGVDGIVTDPPTLESLATAISGHVWLTRSSGPGLGFMPGWQEDSEDGIPILSPRRVAELRTNIPPEDLRERAEECIADLSHRMPALRRSLAAGAHGAIMAHAHAMVGIASGYGLAVLEARLRAVLVAVRNRRLGTIDGAAEVVEADLTRGAAALRRAVRLDQPARSGVQS